MQMQRKEIAIFVAIYLIFFFIVPCQATNREASEQIIFVRNGDLWRIDLKTRRDLLLMKKAVSPSCSKNGKKLAFVREGNIWIGNIDGSKAHRITNYHPNTKHITSIEWFPNGDKLAFCMDDEYEIIYAGSNRKVVWPKDAYEERKLKIMAQNIWTISQDGKNQAKWIGKVPGSGTTGTQLSDAYYPKWSPTGDSLVFGRNGDIWMANIVDDEISEFDKKERRIAAVAYLENHYGASGNSHFADNFSWTPDGKQIVFDIHRHKGSGFGEIWKMNADGTGQMKLFSPNEESFPQISPNGQKIGFIQAFSLWIMGLGGTSPEKLVGDIDMDNIAWCGCNQ